MRHALALALALTLALAADAPAADAPDAETIVRRMKEALEPDRPSTRTLELEISTDDGQTRALEAVQARSADAVLTVMTAPEAVRGTALLVREGRDGRPPTQWLYVPTVRRVRQIVPATAYQPFLGSDFTLGDLGFVDGGGAYSTPVEERQDGRRLYRLEARPREPQPHARVVTWVDAETWLPVRREVYDAANALWKVETFDRVTRVTDVPTPRRVRIEDVQTRGYSEMRIDDLRWDADVPASLFDPAALPGALEAPALARAAEG